MAGKSEKLGLDSAAAVDLKSIVQAEVASAMQGVLSQIQGALAKGGLGALAAAYIEAVKASRDAFKNATNPHLRNQYADLGSVLDSVRQSFLANDLWLMQAPGNIEVKSDNNPYITMTGLLIHKSGQSIPIAMQLPAFSVSKDGRLVLNPQTSGGALSYARRYMWVAVAGITQTDDDAAESSYIDTAAGPAATASPSPSAPQGQSPVASMLERIAAVSSVEALKELRDAANALKDKAVIAAYLAKRETFFGG